MTHYTKYLTKEQQSKMAANVQVRTVSFLARTSLLTVRQSLAGRHDPSLKRKKKQDKDGKKRKVVKLVRKIGDIVPPTDPDSIPNPALLEAARRRLPADISAAEQEKRTILLKEWSRFKMQQHKEELQRLQEMMRCREVALKELKKTSQFLYQEAIKVDKNLFPFQFTGPTETPPIPEYTAPDMEDK